MKDNLLLFWDQENFSILIFMEIIFINLKLKAKQLFQSLFIWMSICRFIARIGWKIVQMSYRSLNMWRQIDEEYSICRFTFNWVSIYRRLFPKILPICRFLTKIMQICRFISSIGWKTMPICKFLTLNCNKFVYHDFFECQYVAFFSIHSIFLLLWQSVTILAISYNR